MNYTFQSIESCNMCGASSENFKTLGKRMNRSQGKNPRKKVGITTTVQQCKSCDLIFSNPMPIPKDLQDHYGMPPENYWVENYFTVEPTYFSGVIQWVNSINPIEKANANVPVINHEIMTVAIVPIILQLIVLTKLRLIFSSG